jgi:hypothetical protein
MAIVLRQIKGSELTFAEVDGNFQSMFYSASLQGSVLDFYTYNNVLNSSFDFSTIPGITGIEVQDGGTPIVQGATGLNFIGSGVTVTANGNTADVTFAGGGDIYTLSAGTKVGASIPLNLDAAAGSDSIVNLVEGIGITLTQNSATSIEIASTAGGIFDQTSSFYATTNNLQITSSGPYQSSAETALITTQNPNNDGTGGGIGKYSTMFTQSVWHYTDNIGYPTSKAWKTDLAGSVFNRYDQNTDTAEIMRFIATTLSASTPDTLPNGKFYQAISEDIQNSSGGSTPVGTVPSVNGNSVITYLAGKGFANSGQSLFEGVTSTFETNANYLIRYDSVAGGTTTVSSSIDSELFNLGIIGVAFNVSGTERREFSDNFAQTQTAATSSTAIYTKTGPGTSADGLTIGDIDGGTQSDVYQDGKFVDILDTGLYNGGLGFIAQEATGKYNIAASIGIQSGSSIYTDANAASDYTKTEEVFFLPSTVIGIPTNTLAQGYFGYEISIAVNACVSRSFSSAPYLQEAIWNNSGSSTGLFDPLFSETQYISRLDENNSFTTLAAGAGGDFRASCQNGTVDIANTIYDSTGAIARSTGTVPQYNDISKLLGLLSFDCTTSNTATNITETSISPTTYPTTLKSRNRFNTESTTATINIPFHTAGDFGKTNVMAYYGASQTYDPGSLTVASENFQGETYRVQITDNALKGEYIGADAWNTAFNLTALGAKDLQVKPNYLVFPGGTRGYYIADPSPSQDYKYYLRAFKRDINNAASSMTVNVGKNNLVNWNSTTNGISVAIIFESAGSTTTSPPRIFDISDLVTAVVQTNVSNDNFKNPFSTNIDLYGNLGGTLVGNLYLIPLRFSDGMDLGATYKNYIVMVRYKNDTDPIEDINITYA